MNVTPNQWTILEHLEGGPAWKRSFHTVTRLVNDLIFKGLVEPCSQQGGRGGNMIRLTDAGCELLEIDPASVPTVREGNLSLAQKRRDRDRKDERVGERQDPPPLPVDREPCPRCEVRKDVGCRHFPRQGAA